MNDTEKLAAANALNEQLRNENRELRAAYEQIRRLNEGIEDLKPVEVRFWLQPDDPRDQPTVEDLTEDAKKRLALAVEGAGFSIALGPDCSEAPDFYRETVR